MNFLRSFAKNGQSNLVLVLVLVLECKGPYYNKAAYSRRVRGIVSGFLLIETKAIVLSVKFSATKKTSEHLLDLPSRTYSVFIKKPKMAKVNLSS